MEVRKARDYMHRVTELVRIRDDPVQHVVEEEIGEWIAATGL